MNAELMSRVFPPLPERLTKDDWQDISDVLDAAAEWDAGRLPLEVFAHTGTMARPAGGLPSAAYTRHVAVRVTSPDDPRWRSLMRALDALADFAGYIKTQHGTFSRDELDGTPVFERRAA